MGFFDNDPFDFNGDGKRSIDEDFMEYQAFKSWLDETEGDDDDEDKSWW